MISGRIKIRRVFVDSSVLIAAAISPTGSARDLIMSSLRKKVKIILSDLVLEETERNLANKAPQALPALKLFLEVLNPEVVIPTRSMIAKAEEIIDVKDAPVIAGAVQAKADYLVSFDRKHLLNHKEEIEAYFKINVATPNEVII